MSNLLAEADTMTDSTTTGLQTVDTGVTKGTGETIEDGLDGLRLESVRNGVSTARVGYP